MAVHSPYILPGAAGSACALIYPDATGWLPAQFRLVSKFESIVTVHRHRSSDALNSTILPNFRYPAPERNGTVPVNKGNLLLGAGGHKSRRKYSFMPQHLNLVKCVLLPGITAVGYDGRFWNRWAA